MQYTQEKSIPEYLGNMSHEQAIIEPFFIHFINSRRKIYALKRYRELTGACFLDSKTAVEDVLNTGDY